MAFDFQDAGDNIVYGSMSLPSAYTWACWINPDAVNTNARQIISVRAGEPNGDAWLEFRAGTNNYLSFGFLDTNGDWEKALWTSGFGAGEWHWVCGTWNGTTQTIYADVDSNSKATNNPGHDIKSGTENISIGHHDVHGRVWDGKIAEVAMWNRVLSAGERLALGNGYSPLFMPNNLDFYAPLVRNEDDIMGKAGTNSGAAVAVHPRIFYPTNQIYRMEPTAAPATVRRYYSPGIWRAV